MLSAPLARLRRLLPTSRAGRMFIALTFLDAVGTGVYLAGAVVYFVRYIHLTNGEIGAALAIAGGVGMVGVVPMGALADRLGAKRLLAAVQFWRAGCFVALAFCTGPVSFCLVSCGLAVAESATPALSQVVIAEAVGADQRNRTMAVVRSVRNMGFAIGSLLAVPLVSTDSIVAGLTIVLGNALSFVVVGVLLARLRITDRSGAAAGAGALAEARGFRNWRYLGLAALNSVFSLHMTLLGVIIPLWILKATDATPSVISVLLLVNTAMAVFLQIPLSGRAEDVAGSTSLLRRTGPALALCCAAMVVASMSSGWIAVGLLVIGMIFMSLAEIWQSAAGWTLSYVFAPAANRAQYLAVFSISGLLAHDIVGPSLLAGPMIDLGRLGWLILAAIFLLAVFLVRPVVGALARRHDAEGAEPPADLGIRGSDSPIQEQS